MNVKTFLCMLLVGLSSAGCLAQKTYSDLTDSLLAQGIIKKSAQSVYIKPIIEQYQSLVSTQGDGFSPPKGDLARKRGVGIRIGYQWNDFEIETGLSTVMPVAGYGFNQQGPYGGYSSVTRSTDFYHLPLILRYRLWQPIRKLTFLIGTGVAYNVDLSKLKLATSNSVEIYAFDPNGNRVIRSRTQIQYNQKESFFSAELNLATQYQFSRHFHAMLEVRRLFGPTNAVRLTATQEQFNPSFVQTVVANGGTNSLSINIGLAYRFSFKNRYQLK